MLKIQSQAEEIISELEAGLNCSCVVVLRSFDIFQVISGAVS